jgi:hypothetical protein
MVIEPGNDLDADAAGQVLVDEVGLPASVEQPGREPQVGGVRPFARFGEH